MIQHKAHIREYQSTLFKDYVAGFRVYEFDRPAILNLDPEGCIELVLQLDGDFMQKSYLDPDWQIRPISFIGGLHSKSFQVKCTSQNARLISIRFLANGARNFLPDRLDLFKNAVVDLSDLGLKFEPRLNPHTEHELIQQLDLFLLELFKDVSRSVIDEAIRLMNHSHGFMSVRAINDSLDISPSYMRKLFNEQVGLSPKEYTKILRVNHSIAYLENRSFASLTELSYQLGYFDQSHFIRDFKSVTGRSPRQYMAAS